MLYYLLLHNSLMLISYQGNELSFSSLVLSYWVLGQLPTGDNSPPDTNKAQLLPTQSHSLRQVPVL